MVDGSFRQAEPMRRRHRRVSPPRSGFAGFRFPREVIVLAVRWYPRYGLSYRDVEELLAERGIAVEHVAIYRWVRRFTPLLIDAAQPCRHVPGVRWFVDETYVKIAGRWRYVYRAIDQYGQVIDVLVSQKRDMAAVRRFFTRALKHGPSPESLSSGHPRRRNRTNRQRQTWHAEQRTQQSGVNPRPTHRRWGTLRRNGA